MEVDLGGSDHFSREVTCNVVRSKFRYGFSHVERVKCTLNRASARIYNIERSVLGVHAPFPHDHIKIELTHDALHNVHSDPEWRLAS